MVKFHTDLLDALANPDIKAKFSDLLSDSIQSTVQKSIDKAVQKAFDKHVGDLIAKIEELSTSVSTLRLQIESKNAIIADLQAKNDALSNEICDAQAMNDELQQEVKRDNLIFSGFTPSYSEMVAGEGGNYRRRVSVQASINNVVTFCQKSLAMPEISAHDISSAVFLPPPKSGTMTSRLLCVRFTRRCVRDNIIAKRRLLKAVNQTSGSKYFINEDLTHYRRELFLEARRAVKDKHLAATWTSGGVIHIKKSEAGRVEYIYSKDELHHILRN